MEKLLVQKKEYGADQNVQRKMKPGSGKILEYGFIFGIVRK